ncbi:MAG: ABC transporter ATP-binding protein [Bacteroidetes bacterium]|nr:ABC transporter ATP-binding protein [Bacteroidota bacterium]MBP6314525.1 ABC transporter ATP-binding protein [Chitinophagaceae bacterium]
MDEMLLHVENLSVTFHSEYEHVQSVRTVNFQLAHGETLAIVGESGSGKSVTALSIMQLLSSNARIDPQSKISFFSKNNRYLELTTLEKNNIEMIRGFEMAMIFQEPMTSLNPLMKCGEQVSEALRLHLKMNKEAARQKTLSLFEEVKIPNPEQTYSKYPHELSGGQKQRIMIAMAISCHPKLLIADEPTTALDVRVQKNILTLLKELQIKYKMSILFITHDLNLVRSFADRALVMFKGSCVELGTIEPIFTNPQHPYTKSLINCRPASDVRVHYLSTVEEIGNGLNSTSNSDNVISPNQFEKRISNLEKEERNILELKDLEVWYATERNFWGKGVHWHKAVNGVNMAIKQGETMGLVGESGCGKTTIGKAIVKLVEIASGEILYKGKNIADFSKSEMQNYRKEVQIIFQDPYSSLNPRIAIGNAIKEPMDVHGIENAPNRKAKVISLLEKVGLDADHYYRYPHEFSGGQRQRISIARALALNAQCIICDESVSALDVSVQAQVLNLLVRLREEFNFTYLFISHDLNVIKHISDHVAVMSKGKIVERNNAEALFAAPTENYTRDLLDSLQF